MNREAIDSAKKIVDNLGIGGDYLEQEEDAIKEITQEIERLLAAEREPMECGHPKACWHEATLPTTLSVCKWCLSLNLLEKVYQHAGSIEREKVREMCAEVAKDFCDESVPESPVSVQYLTDKYGTLEAEQAIRQLDLTKDEGSQEKVDV